MSTEPLDPAAIMAEHQPGDTGQWCLSCIGGVDEDPGVSRSVEHEGANIRLDYVLPAAWPCEPYLLAAELAAMTADRDRWELLTAETVDERDMYRTDLAAERERVRRNYKVNNGLAIKLANAEDALAAERTKAQHALLVVDALAVRPQAVLASGSRAVILSWLDNRLGDLRAALAGEGAADQPQPKGER